MLGTLAQAGYAQKRVEFTHFTTRDGLSKSYVKTILQDHEGFLWLGTPDGLNRYDGYGFHVYREDSHQPHSLSGNEISTLLEDQHQQLWIGTNGGGLNRYLPDQDAFVAYRLENSGLQSNQITALAEAADGTLWIGTSRGLHHYDAHRDLIVHDLTDAEGRPVLPAVTALAADPRGHLWVGTPEGLRVVQQNRLIAPGPTPLAQQAVAALMVDATHLLWVGSAAQGIYVVAPEAATATPTIVHQFRHQPQDPASLGSDIILTLFQDRQQRIWIGTDLGGLNYYDAAHQRFVRYQHDNRLASSLSSNNVLSIEEDHAGNLWIGTNFGGLNLMEQNPTFEHYKSNPYHYASSPVLSIYVDQQQKLWIGTDGNGLTCQTPEGGFQEYLYTENRRNSLGGNTIQRIFEDAQGNLWLGTYNNGISVMHRDGTFSHYQSHDQHGLSHHDVRTFLVDHKGHFWVGTNGGGLNLYQPERDRFQAFRAAPGTPYGLTSDSIVSLYEDSRGMVWVGTVHGGVCFFDPGQVSSEGINFYRIQLPVNDRHKLYGNSVLSITEDSYGNMWFGNYVSGISYMNYQTRQLRQYDKNDGLPGNVINGLLPGHEGTVWISTSQGLARYQPEQDTFEVFDERDGLQGNEFLHGAAFQAPDGKLYFGGINGVNAFYADSIHPNTYPPTVHITGISSFNEPVAYTPDASPRRSIVLRPQQSTFTFDFVALSYPRAENNRYAVKLEGFEEEWRPLGTHRSATYTNIPPGTYTFRVKGSNCDGIWNERGAAVTVHLLAPWWKTGWAYALYLVVLGCILFFAITLTVKRAKLNERLKLIEREKAYEHQIHQAKLDFFTNVSHEFRTPLTLILSPLEKMLSQGDTASQRQHELMYRNARSLLRLVDEILDFRKATEGNLQLRVSEVELVTYVQSITTLFQDLSQHKRLRFAFDTDLDQLTAWVDTDKLERVIYNLLSNAFKFTPEGGQVALRLRELSPEVCEIAVSDTGPGIPMAEQEKIFQRFYQAESPSHILPSGTGIGLALVKELVSLHHGTVTVDSAPGQGTTFRLVLPISQQRYAPHEVVHTAQTPGLSEPLASTVLPSAAPEPAQTHDTTPDRASLPQVLVVDDNADLRALLRENLTTAYRVLEATNGQEAIGLAREAQPDLIVTDVMMPVMDGYALCAALKKDIHTSHIPVIVLTARNSLEQQIRGLETGADAYISKPFSLELLETRVRKLIETRRQLIERFSQGEVLAPEALSITSVDQRFLEQVKAVLERHIDDVEFRLEVFCKEVGMSHTQLYNKIKALTGFSPNELIRDFRLKRAVQLLRESDLTINEVAVAVGFNDAKYFSRSFRKQFDQTPSEYIQAHRQRTRSNGSTL